jgi:polar amino acid transport system substrate-binding protein
MPRSTWLASVATAAALIVARPVFGADISELHAFAEDRAPYNFAENGEARGVSTDLLRAICVEAKIKCVVTIVPWARAYHEVLTTPNTLLFSTARTAERRDSFVWIGPFLPRKAWIYGRASDGPSVDSLGELSKFHVGVVSDDAAVSDLTRAGVSPSALDMASSSIANTRKLLAGRVDFIVSSDVTLAWELRQLGAERDSVRRLLILSEKEDYYFALNAQSDAQLVGRLRQAFQTIQSRHSLDSVLIDYLGEAALLPSGEKR